MKNLLLGIFGKEQTEKPKTIKEEKAEAMALFESKEYDKVKYCATCNVVHLAIHKKCPVCDMTLKPISEKFEHDRREEDKEKIKSIECPYCHSNNIKKITVITRTTSTVMWGIGSGKMGKQWHCNNCKSDF